MKSFLSTSLVAAAVLLAGAASAGDSPRSDAPHAMRADTDGDGRISRAEAEAAADTKTGDWFAKTDLNKDGYVTQDEMRQARETRRDQNRAELKQKAEARFKETDANGDGSLSLDEVQAKNPRLAERFATLDTDKNGLLSREELWRGGPHRGAKPQS